ncbi:MAG: hypothetical protein HYT76_07400 [Deltaproteobacteria bacterium]|nr:hypothetical protein [Deltaproteobacteria bacterium]
MALRETTGYLFSTSRLTPIQGAPDPIQDRSGIDHYLSPEFCQIGKGLLAVSVFSLGIYATLRLVGGGVLVRFLSAVRWNVSARRFHSPVTLHETELLTAFRRGEDGVYQIEKVMTGSHSKMLAPEPLTEVITEAPTLRFSYKARAETVRFLPRADGSISLSFVDVGGEGGQVVFGVGTPWHRFLIDNQTLWDGKRAGTDHCWLAERLAMLMTAPGTESFIALERGGVIFLNPSVRGVTGHPVSAVTRLARRGKGRAYTYGVREVDMNGVGWDTEIDPFQSYLSTPVPGWWKVSFGHKPFGTNSFLNGSILVREDTRSGRTLECFRKTWVQTGEEAVYRLPHKGFEAFLVTLPFDHR